MCLFLAWEGGATEEHYITPGKLIPEEYPKHPSVLKIVRDSELLRRSAFYYAPHIYYAVNHSLRGEMPVKPRKLMYAQGGRDSNSLCDSKFTTHCQLTIVQYF